MAQGRVSSPTRRVCECQLCLRSVRCDGISCLDQKSSFTLSSTPSKILLSQFSHNRHLAPFSKQSTIILSPMVSFYRIHWLVNNINISNMLAVSRWQVKNYAGASCPKFHRASRQLRNIANFQMKIVTNFPTLQRTKVNSYFCSIEFGYHFSCNWM